MEDRDSGRLTDVVDAVGHGAGHDDDPIGMRIGPGTEVGGYVIDGELGHGGMGVVYSAVHPVIGKRAAVKILRLDVSRSPIAVERFIQEARAVNQIGHPNIIDIFAYGALPDGRAYHVMDLLVGESLRRRLKRGVLHPSEAASVIDEVASALQAAHDHGFVHRDLKPDNVFLVHHEGRWPEVKLLDFGLAKLMPEYGVPAFTTKTGVMLGTPEYMSPEQARGTGVDYRTDIYALGIVMFEVLAGHRPFPQLGDSLATLLQHAEEPPASLGDTVAGLPAEMVQLVDTMLAKTPAARPSLAAVRTVIKRLRTTQLPTRSVAGVSMAAFQPPAHSGSMQRPGMSAQTVPSVPSVQTVASRGEPPSRLPQSSAEALLGITASRVGAEAVLPGDSQLAGRPLPSPQTTTPGVGVEAVWSKINAPRPGASQSQPPPMTRPPSMQPPSMQPPIERPRSPSSPPYSAERPHSPSSPPYSAERPRSPSSPPHSAERPHSPSSPPYSAERPHSLSSPPYSAERPHSPSSPPYSVDPGRSAPGVPSRPIDLNRSSPGMAPQASGSLPSGGSSQGLRAGSQRIPATQLGVGPPPKPRVPVAKRMPRSQRVWLAIAAILVAAGGAALVIALAG